MKIDTSKQFFFLITGISILPYIIFLGKNSLQTEFLTINFFYFAVIYIFSFICAAFFAMYLSKKLLIFILFFAYLNFLQFYFMDMQNFLGIYKNDSTGFYVLFFIFFISIIGTLSSNYSIFRNFIFILIFLNVTVSTYSLIPSTERFLKIFFKTTNQIDNFSNTKNFSFTKLPNIFYIVPDGLASPKILNDYVNIDFKDSIKKFEDKAFSVSEHIYSSYNSTYLSLAALFEMDYPVTVKSPKYKNRSEFYPSIREKKPNLVQYLTKNNYRFLIAPPLWGGCPTGPEYKCLVPENYFFPSFLQDYATVSFIQKSLLYKLYIIFQDKYFGLQNSEQNDMNDSIRTVHNKMKKNPEIWSDGGVFTMIHTLMPHSPYREKNCSIIDKDRYTTYSKEGYRSTVYCTFKRIHELSDFIIKNYPNATIIVQADHGIYPEKLNENAKFDDIPDTIIDHRLGMFNAVRGCNSNQAINLNQVNIIKYVVECLTGDIKIKSLDIKSYFGFYEEAPEYGRVFRVR